jgi:hypothetical protein
MQYDVEVLVVRRGSQEGTRRINESITLRKIRLVTLVEEPNGSGDFMLFDIIAFE